MRAGLIQAFDHPRAQNPLLIVSTVGMEAEPNHAFPVAKLIGNHGHRRTRHFGKRNIGIFNGGSDGKNIVDDIQNLHRESFKDCSI